VSGPDVPRHLVVAAWESLAVGDHGEALAILGNALEEDGPEPPPCSICSARAWPGDERAHIWSAHYPAEERRAA
jgi:hypothetical protein